MRLAVIVVSYNVRDLLRSSLRSVAAAATRPDDLEVEILVVDNASTDGSAAMVAAEFPQIRLLALAHNTGFTGGNNLALHALGFPVAPPAPLALPQQPSTVPPDYVLLLNPDAELIGDALRKMTGFLAAYPGVAVCGARLQYGDGQFQHGAFRFPSVAQVAIDLFPPVGLPGAHRLLDSGFNGRYPHALWDGESPFPVDFVLGAAMMVRGAAIVRAGAFDDGYWMYCEEMDWCLRLRDLGLLTYAVPAARVVHHEGRSSRQVRWFAFERLWRSRFRFYRQHVRHYPPLHQAAVRMLLRAYLADQQRATRVAFAQGALTGTEAAEALAAYTSLARI